MSVEHTTASESFTAFYLRDPESDHLDHHLNDGECGAVGTLWATAKTMYEKEKWAAVYCFPANLSAKQSRRIVHIEWDYLQCY